MMLYLVLLLGLCERDVSAEQDFSLIKIKGAQGGSVVVAQIQ